ncbi:MAG: hypothetical protein H8D45_04305 [Bacteroidetes bacterium]|nr:hypothetical protein [Bacteroidota bacterium]MBL7103708.1 glycogen-binding domain-containing protein [Bacteroidales bacterium]
MKIDKTNIILFLAISLMALSACKKAVVRVDSIPSNTPKNQPIYITGNFNNWDPGEERYRMQLNDDSTYTVNLPPGFGTVEYKFTRGDWTTIEKDICGYEIDNRRLVLGEQDIVSNEIASWNDLDPVNCPRITLVIDSIPLNTPDDDVIAIAGNFNAWNPDDSAVLRKDSAGRYSLTVDRVPGIKELEFKVTRGNLSTAESDEFGNVIPNRRAQFGVKDTVKLSINGWVDTPTEKSLNRVIFIIKSLPKSTPPGDELYLISNLNDWAPADRNYIFQKNKQGNYFYPFPRKRKMLEFKITRGRWSAVEVDRFGYEIPNRVVNIQVADTVYLSIGGWKDFNRPSDFEVTIKLGKLPEPTPENSEFYLVGDINSWNPGRNKYRFKQDDSGNYFLNVPRGGHMFGYKITRGSWRSVEVNRYGSDIPNRMLFYKDADTVVVDIENWKDLPPLDPDQVTIVIDKLPVMTPQTESIYLAPDFNGWNPGDDHLVFNYLPDGSPYITIPSRRGSTEYKITRGNWETAEVDQYGNEISNRILNYGFADTVYIKVAAWRDFDGQY